MPEPIRHIDFASSAPVHDPWVGTQARPIDRTVYEAPGVPAALPPALRSAVPVGAPVALRQPGRQPVPVDRGASPRRPGRPRGRRSPEPCRSRWFRTVEHRIADAPVPGTVPATRLRPVARAAALPGARARRPDPALPTAPRAAVRSTPT